MVATLAAEAGAVTPLLTILGVAGGFFGVVGLLAGAGAVVRSSSVKANLELLRGEVADLSNSNARLDGENSQLQKEVEVLRELVTGRAAVDTLTGAVQSLEKTLTAQHGVLMGQLAHHGRSSG
jgi:hypothetical protein